MKLIKKKLVLFDLDGVLIDSKSNMELAWKDVCAQLELDTPFEDYFSKIGRPFKEILSIIGINENQDLVEHIYNKSSLKRIRDITFFYGVKDYLHFLSDKNIKIGIVTSKSKIRVTPILKELGIDFSIVKTPDDVCRGKPSPDHLLMAMALLNVDPIESIFIGDMDVDFMAAQRAHIDYLHVAWGYGEHIEGAKIINQLTDINQYIFGSDK